MVNIKMAESEVKEPKKITVASFDGDISSEELRKHFPSVSMVSTDEYENISIHDCNLHGISRFEAIKFAPRHSTYRARVLTQIYCILYDTPLSLVLECRDQLNEWIKKEDPKGKYGKYSNCPEKREKTKHENKTKRMKPVKFYKEDLDVLSDLESGKFKPIIQILFRICEIKILFILGGHGRKIHHHLFFMRDMGYIAQRTLNRWDYENCFRGMCENPKNLDCKKCPFNEEQ
jgi:hypothetical protein